MSAPSLLPIEFPEKVHEEKAAEAAAARRVMGAMGACVPPKWANVESARGQALGRRAAGRHGGPRVRAVCGVLRGRG